MPFALVCGYVANPTWMAAARELLACREVPAPIIASDERYVVSGNRISGISEVARFLHYS